jgi:hypothetical protein
METVVLSLREKRERKKLIFRIEICFCRDVFVTENVGYGRVCKTYCGIFISSNRAPLITLNSIKKKIGGDFFTHFGISVAGILFFSVLTADLRRQGRVSPLNSLCPTFSMSNSD